MRSFIARPLLPLGLLLGPVLFGAPASGQVVPLCGTAMNDTIEIWFDTTAGVHKSRVNGGPIVPHPGATGFVVTALAGDDTVDGRAFMFPDAPVQVPMEVHGGPGKDRIIGGDADDELHGDEDDDEIFGFSGDDDITGDGGHDKLFGGPGTDTIEGGPGNDLLVGDADRDFLSGQDGDDQIWGDFHGCAGIVNLATDGEDCVSGGDGRDTIFGCGRNDTLTGEEEKDLIYGNAGHDVITGGPGPDKIFGGFGNDSISGQGDGDSLFGEFGVDGMSGDDGDDRMFGGPHTDVMFGDAGNDKVFGQGAAEATLQGNDGDDLVVGGPDAVDSPDGGEHVAGDTCAELGQDALVACEIHKEGVGEIGAADPVTATFDPVSGIVSFEPPAVIDWLANGRSVQDVDMFVAIDAATGLVVPGLDVVRSGGAIEAIAGLASPDPLLGGELRLSPIVLRGRDGDGRFLFGDGTIEILGPAGATLVTASLVGVRLDPVSSMFGGALSDVVIDGGAGSGILAEMQAAVDGARPVEIWIVDSQATAALLADTAFFTVPGTATGAAEIEFESLVSVLDDGRPFPTLLSLCGEGVVDAASGRPAEVLRVNGSAGDPETRRVAVGAGERIEIALLASPAGPAPALYVLWVWPGPPLEAYELERHGRSLGCVLGATPLHPLSTPQPVFCVRAAGVPSAACRGTRELAGPGRAPFTIARNRGLPRAIELVLQAVLQDRGSATGASFSASNAVILEVGM